MLPDRMVLACEILVVIQLIISILIVTLDPILQWQPFAIGLAVVLIIAAMVLYAYHNASVEFDEEWLAGAVSLIALIILFGFFYIIKGG